MNPRPAKSPRKAKLGEFVLNYAILLFPRDRAKSCHSLNSLLKLSCQRVQYFSWQE